MTHKTHTNHAGRFNVRIVEVGDAYGRDDCLTHDDDLGLGTLVEFYDGQQDAAKFGPLGQFVARYYFDTLAESVPQGGLNLDGGIPEWTVSAEEFATHWRWILENVGGIEA